MAFFGPALYAQLPTVIPPSPEASALFRMLDFSVNNSRGVPQISIPIYEIKSGSLSVPISISYNAEGRKAFDQTGPVGLGWSLNAGGMISRTIHGKPDDRYHFPYDLRSAITLNNKNDYDYLTSIYSGYEYDSEYDIFSYYFGSNSGKFVSDPMTNEICLLPTKPLKIESNAFPSKIIDDKGVVYRFESNEYSNEPGNPITSKLLTSITSADGGTNITFTYTVLSSVDAQSTQDYIITDNDSRLDDQAGYRRFSTTLKNNNNYRTYSIQRLKEITFPEGKLSFNIESGTDRIKSIQVFNKAGEVIKTIEFERSLLDAPRFSGMGFTYKLDNLYFKDRYVRTVEKYSFEYEPSLSNLDTRSRDYWGYLNGASNNIAVPEYLNIDVYEGYNGKDLGTTVNINGGSRTSDITSKAGVLKKIVYPTGGSTEFSYESNRYWHVDKIITGGGLRVSEIKSTDNNGSILLKTYRYGTNECGYGTISFYNVQQNDMSYEKRVMTGLRQDNGSGNATESYRTRMYSSEFLPEISEIAYDPVFYPQITEYAGTTSQNTGKSVYTYIDKDHSTITQFPSPSFPGNTRYGNFEYPIDSRLGRRCVGEYNLWKQSNLQRTDLYKNTGDTANPYQIVKSLVYNYHSTQTKTLKGLHIYKYLEFPEGSDEYTAAAIGLPVFLLADYQITVGKEELESTSETDYTDNGVINTGSTYQYNDQSLVSEIQKTASNQKLLVTRYKYPADFTSAPLYSYMTYLNMLNYVVEENQFVNHLFMKGTKTNYMNWSNTPVPNIYPQTIEEKVGEKDYETRLRFYGYSARGNILAVSKENDVKQSYIWGYDNAYPIARVINAEAKDIFHTSFEDSEGNTSDGNSKTGYKSKIGGYRRLISGLTNGEYILSWWEKTGGVWILQTNVVTVITNAYAIDLSGQVDEIRFYPKAAQMTTYTYDPLVGLRSECDLNDQVTFFEYDGFGRLSLIRDNDRNILKKYDYQYARQQSNCCQSTYMNMERSQNYKRNNCSPGYDGSTVTYTLPAGVYSSTQSQRTADSLAQADLDTNGQQYANLHATCSLLYAALSYEYLFTDLSGSYAEVYIRFYSDRNKTQPVNPDNLVVNYKKTDSGTYPYEWNYSIRCTGDVLLEYTMLQGFVDGVYHGVNFGLLNGNYTIIY